MPTSALDEEVCSYLVTLVASYKLMLKVSK